MWRVLTCIQQSKSNWTSGTYGRSSVLHAMALSDRCLSCTVSTVKLQLSHLWRSSYGWEGRCEPVTFWAHTRALEKSPQVIPIHMAQKRQWWPSTWPPLTWGCWGFLLACKIANDCLHITYFCIQWWYQVSFVVRCWCNSLQCWSSSCLPSQQVSWSCRLKWRVFEPSVGCYRSEILTVC